MRRHAWILGGTITGVGLIASCQDPTEITVRITSGEPCTSLNGAAITTGPDVAETDRRFVAGYVSTTTSHCEKSGVIGTLVLTPGAQSGSVIVAAGVHYKDANGNPRDQDPTSCGDPASLPNCIIARRSFAFISHHALILPIDLDPTCLGKQCDPGQTCFKGGCVSEVVTCSGENCGLSQEHPGVGSGDMDAASSDDGAYDAEFPDGMMSFEDGAVFSDGASSDGTTVTDAGSDGPNGTGTDAANGLMPCAGLSGTPAFSASCQPTTNGTTVNQFCPGVTMGPPFCCSCACNDGVGIGHGIVQCATSMMGAGCRDSCK